MLIYRPQSEQTIYPIYVFSLYFQYPTGFSFTDSHLLSRREFRHIDGSVYQGAPLPISAVIVIRQLFPPVIQRTVDLKALDTVSAPGQRLHIDHGMAAIFICMIRQGYHIISHITASFHISTSAYLTICGCGTETESNLT